jgi:signal transduction histidine kinase
MSVGKNVRVEGRQKLGPRAARTSGASVTAPEGVPVLVDEKVLAEIAHELGNFFHKLYYWSDYLKEHAPQKAPADSTAAQMMERTIKNLEDFLKLSLDYFHPLQLSFIRMRVGEVVQGLLGQVRAQLNGTPATVAQDGEWAGEEILVDPSHLSRAFEVTLRHLTKQVGAGSAACIAVARSFRGNSPGLELTFHLERASESSPLFRTSEAGIEWAVAQKVVALHGGELRERTQGPGEKSLVVFLPLVS